MMRSNNLKGSLILITAALIWGLAFVAQSSAADRVPPFLMNCLRSFISAAFLTVILRIKGIKSGEPIIPKDKAGKKICLAGGLVCGLMLAVSVNLQQFGIALYPKGAASEAHAGFITAMYVMIVPLLSLFAGKKVGVGVWLGVGISVIGFYLLCLSGGVDGLYLGDLLVLLCAFSFSFHIHSVDKFVEQVGGIRLSMLQFLVCGAVSGVLSLIFEISAVNLTDILSAIWQILYLGIMSSGVAYTLQIIGQRYAEPSIASLSMSLESVFAALGGWFAGNFLSIGAPRSLSVNEILGCVLVFAAIVFAQLPMFNKNNN
jgi:drug/metabolite transporter (DMT)-like permease